jgi:hypothetical protein
LTITWIPQILHNAIYRNQTSIPLINIILNTLNKILIPIYFRGCPTNIFYVKTDMNFIYFCLGIIGFELLFLYLQTLCGPRFFIPCKFQVNDHKFYYTKEELLSYKKEFEHVNNLK